MKGIVFGAACMLAIACVSQTTISAQELQPDDATADMLMVPISNEVSFYKNVDDDGIDRGTTLQVISINMFNLGTDFIIEFTGDFNWGMDLFDEYDYDYYVELSLVKPVYKSLSFNYQRIYGSFASGPVNQLGLRVSLFSGS